MRHGVLRRVDGRHQIHVEHARPVLGGEAVERAGRHAADVVDENVDAAQAFGRLVDEPLAAVLACEIGGDREARDVVPGDFARGLVQPLLAARRQGDVAAFGSQRVRDREADALARARDGGVLTRESEIHDVVCS